MYIKISYRRCLKYHPWAVMQTLHLWCTKSQRFQAHFGLPWQLMWYVQPVPWCHHTPVSWYASIKSNHIKIWYVWWLSRPMHRTKYLIHYWPNVMCKWYERYGCNGQGSHHAGTTLHVASMQKPVCHPNVVETHAPERSCNCYWLDKTTTAMVWWGDL